MAIISFTNYKRGQTTGCMGAVMRYTMQNKKTEFEGQQLVAGINCQPESVYGAPPGDDRGRTKILCPLHLFNCRESKNTYGADAPNHRQ